MFDVPKEVLYADFFGLLGLDRGWDVQEGFTGFGSILDKRTDLRACTVYEGNDRRALTSLISSTAKYASVGIPTVCGRTSTMTITGRAINRLKRSLISWSEARSLGPV